MNAHQLNTTAGTVYFSWKKTLWLYLMLLPIALIDFSAVGWEVTSLTLALTLLTVGIGHSVGLHRGVIHRSYRTSSTFRSISLYLFVLTGLGSPLSWLKQHYYRDYWQNRNDCPRYFQYKHSLGTDYWWNLHLQFSPKSIGQYNIPKKDLEDPVILWLHKTWYMHYLGLALLILVLFGINTMLITTFFRTGVIILGHWYIGYASHKFGYSRYEIQGADESGYNDMVLGLISFGEGFHNNHHSHPSSAKFSMKWYEIDLGWALVWLLIRMRLVTEVKTQEETLKETALPLRGLNWKLPWNL